MSGTPDAPSTHTYIFRVKPQIAEPLPKCEYRVPLSRPSLNYCLHSQVRVANNVVSDSMCVACMSRETPCSVPRPIPEVAKNTPSLLRRAWNLTTSLASFVADGLRTVTKEEYEQRLSICDSCPERKDDKCLHCGCRLSLKARGRAFDCPLDKWPKMDELD